MNWNWAEHGYEQIELSNGKIVFRMPQYVLDYEQGKDKFSKALENVSVLTTVDEFGDNTIEHDVEQMLTFKKEADFAATNSPKLQEIK